MIKRIKTEIIYFVGILVVLALIQHPDLLSSPSTRIEQLQLSGDYLHPLLFTSIVYVVVGIFRAIVGFILKLRKKGE
ncbi:MAG: hypothetical protein IE916_07125 [Epsilonproteobacteria bacterium]|nr:hypothetical protein [Campylobacterota bacterium]